VGDGTASVGEDRRQLGFGHLPRVVAGRRLAEVKPRRAEAHLDLLTADAVLAVPLRALFPLDAKDVARDSERYPGGA
jgi:hypothetical protein